MGFLTDLMDGIFSTNQQPETLPEDANQARSSRREERIRNEVMMIAPRFSRNDGSIDFDEENCDWLIINQYALPERWREWYCRLMIIFPQGYPDMPPIGFYLNKKFSLKKGKDSHFTGKSYYGAPNLVNQGWHWYCVHLQNGAWQPQADHSKPDNLYTYFNMIRESLTNDF